MGDSSVVHVEVDRDLEQAERHQQEEVSRRPRRSLRLNAALELVRSAYRSDELAQEPGERRDGASEMQRAPTARALSSRASARAK